MRRALPLVGLAASVVLAAASVGAVTVAAESRRTATRTLAGAEDLRSARLEVAEAEKKLGGSDVDDAVRSARRANRTALRVGRVIRKIARTLRPAADAAERSLRSARRGSRGALLAKRQTRVAAEALGAIAGYQSAASRSARITNRALRRILEALRETNREFPGRGR